MPARPQAGEPSWFVLDASLVSGMAGAAQAEQAAESIQKLPAKFWATNGHLGLAFEAVALASGLKSAVEAEGQRVSYQALLAAAYAVRDVLRDAPDFCVGDRVVLLLPNTAEYIAAFYGTLLAGGIVVPLPPDAEDSRVSFAVATTNARCVFSSARVIKRRRPRLSRDPVAVRSSSCAVQARLHGVVHLPAAHEPAAIFFTSGSSGEPKGVTLSHRNLLSNAASIIEYLEINSEERALGLLPFYHAFGNSVMQSHLLSGATLVMAGSTLFPQMIVDAVREHRVTSVSGVPGLFQSLLARTSLGETDLPSLRYLAVAGGRLDPDQAQTLAFRAAPANVIIMYGQTEATARLSYLPAADFEDRYASIGKGIPGVQLEVVDEDGAGIKPGQTGEIRARGRNIMLGYWNDPEATAKALRDGWLYTGDLATIDADGFIYPQGRKSGLVKIAGYRVHPAEIEDFVRREATVLEAVVVPYESPSSETRLALFVQPWSSADGVTDDLLRSLCVNRLPRHQVPEHVEVLDRLPLNDAHKVDRQNLRARAEVTALTEF